LCSRGRSDLQRGRELASCQLVVGFFSRAATRGRLLGRPSCSLATPARETTTRKPKPGFLGTRTRRQGEHRGEDTAESTSTPARATPTQPEERNRRESEIGELGGIGVIR
jgi:hypothetical protein